LGVEKDVFARVGSYLERCRGGNGKDERAKLSPPQCVARSLGVKQSWCCLGGAQAVQRLDQGPAVPDERPQILDHQKSSDQTIAKLEQQGACWRSRAATATFLVP
jgi:hypothetical protein